MPYSEPLLFLLAQKKELVFQMLRMANDTEFSGTNTENAEKFISLVAAREVTVEKLKKLDIEIARLQESHVTSGESSPIDREIKEMTAQIARVELDISQKTLGIMDYLQKEIKDLNNRKKASNAYDPY